MLFTRVHFGAEELPGGVTIVRYDDVEGFQEHVHVGFAKPFSQSSRRVGLMFSAAASVCSPPTSSAARFKVRWYSVSDFFGIALVPD